MPLRATRSAPAIIAVLLTLLLAACGDSDDDSTTSAGGSTTTSASADGGGKYLAGAPVSGKKGGTLTFLTNSGFEHLDPGIAYYQVDYEVVTAVGRGLYYYKADDAQTAVPDIASGAPQVSADGKTVTVKIKDNVKYATNDTSSSVNGQTVKAADIKYAIERGFNSHVASGYVGLYFPIVGSKDADGGPISGIETPDDTTLVFKLSTNFGGTMVKALTMPITIPVPKAYAEKYDKQNPSGFDADPTKLAFTGPYMIKAYTPNKSLQLVRNPKWDGAGTGDVRPAYLDTINYKLGADPNVSGRQILTGTGLVNGDSVAAPLVKQFATKAPKQINFTPLGNRWTSLNTQKKPFNNLNVRKAAAAILDRRAMQLARGGAITGDIATHFIPPGQPGYEEAGGANGAGVDFLKNPSGDLALAQSYMKKGGYPSGSANGETIRVIGDNASPAKENAQIVQSSLEKLGFKVKINLVERSTFYSKYCTNTATLEKSVDVCTNFGWLPDFPDPYAMLYVNFHGKPFPAVNNQNPSLFNDPAIAAEMEKGATIADTTQRDQAWGNIDKQLVQNVAAIPWFWDKQANIVSKDVNGVIAQWNGIWDLSYMSLK